MKGGGAGRRVCAIYSRKSRFTGKGESIENQIELCRRYIRLHWGEEEAGTDLVYEDEGFSGGTLARPHFQKMMADARSGQFSVLVCYRLDRISRSIGDFAGLIQELHDLGVSFVSIKEQFDTESPMGRAMMYIASVFSQLERETIAERIRDNMHELAKTGRWLGGVTPTGFSSEAVERITVDGKTRRSCRLTLIPEEGELVRTIFHVFLSAGSLTGTDAFLLRHGYRSKNGKPFSRYTIKGILTNPVYLTADREALAYFQDQGVEVFAREAEFDGIHGMLAYNRTLQRQGKAHQFREVGEWIVSVGGHPGLIPGTEWVRVQELLAGNRGEQRRPKSKTALLSGLLRCGRCGGPMRPKLTQRRDGGGEQVYAYLCTAKERSKGACCCVSNVEGGTLDRAVLSVLSTLPGSQAVFSETLRGAEQSVGAADPCREELLRLSERKRRVEGEIAALVSALAKAENQGAAGPILERIEALRAQQEALEEDIRAQKGTQEDKALPEEQLLALAGQLATLDGTAYSLNIEQRRTLIRMLVSRVEWEGDQAAVFLAEKGGSVPSGENSK